MSADGWGVTFSGTDRLAEILDGAGEGAGEAIQEAYEQFGQKKLKQEIIERVHPSGRKFKGHTKGAKEAGADRVLKHAINGLDLTVTASGRWGYLFFPDTGTGKHQPKAQNFMGKGLEASADYIIDRCVDAIIYRF